MKSLLERCRIAPPPHTVADQSLPLTFLDFMWLTFHPVRRLLFYEIPNVSKPHFIETLVPKLKESLSLTLKHFFPLAGTIVYPLNLEKLPEIHYRAGDSVFVTIFECTDDFDYLVGNQAKDADKFYDFMPPSEPIEESDRKLIRVSAIQVTLFPGRGVCIGFSFSHCAGDATFVEVFFKSWALINKLGREKGHLVSPVFDRALIKYSPELDSVFLNRIKKIPMSSHSFPLPTDRVRATYIFTQSGIKNLKNLARERVPNASSFVVVGAYVWHCLAKSVTDVNDDENDNKPEFLLFAVDARARLDPPVPGNYLGNCLSFGFCEIGHGELVGEEGFFRAAEVIVEEVKKRVVSLGGGENRVGEVVRNRVLSVSGSTRFDLYGADFGWGRARKIEALSIDRDKYAMTLGKSRDGGALEVGLSLPKDVMEAFGARFYDGIRGNVVVSRL